MNFLSLSTNLKSSVDSIILWALLAYLAVSSSILKLPPDLSVL
jgi:hypothetical protein